MSPPIFAAHAAFATQVLRETGWIQGQYGDEDLGYCLMGAVGCAHRALGITGLHFWLDDWARDHGYPDPAKWNDAPGRTIDEVFALLQEVANA